MTERKRDATGASYDEVAGEYVRRIFGELEHKLFDRELLDRFTRRVRKNGIVADLGCGPGHVGRYLSDRGLRVCGVDLSARMIEHARRLNPDIEFIEGDMRALDVPNGAWSGIVAFYSLIHVARDAIVDVLRELERVLEPDGVLLMAFHIGDHVVHLDDWWGHNVSLDFVLFQQQEMLTYLAAAGFEIEDALERDPYAPDVAHQSRRCYIRARASKRGVRTAS